jgi:hypothetical protein
MKESEDIVKLNFEKYNKKLVFQDSILIVSLLFILVNLFLVVEPNYSAFQKLSFQTVKINSYSKKIDNYKADILKEIPINHRNSVSLADSNFKSSAIVFGKLKPYTTDTTELASKIGSIQTALDDKNLLVDKNDSLKKKIADSKDAISLIRILLFINDGSAHFALFLSFVVLFVLLYFYFTRKYLLNLLARTLRIQKEKQINKYYEYALGYSIWLTPIPNNSSYSISSEELVNVLSIRNTHKAYKKIIVGCLSLLVIVQLRLYFIELDTNNLSLNLYSILSIALAMATGITAYLWITQKYIPDNFNSEEAKRRDLNRREFLAIATSAASIALITLGLPILKHFGQTKRSAKIYNRLFNKPRYVSRKKKLQHAYKTKTMAFERNCLDLLVKRQYARCVGLLIPEVKKTVLSKGDIEQKRALRLSDMACRVLLFMIHREGMAECEKQFTDLIETLNKSSNSRLRIRAKNWADPQYKWILVCKNKMNIIQWNNIKFT